MISLWVLAAICFCGTQGSSFDGRIINGKNAEPNEFPFAASIRYKGKHVCGGTIIDDSYVLTAAGCVQDRKNDGEFYTVQYGVLKLSESGNVAKVSKIMRYHKHSIFPMVIHDVAVIKLAEPVKFSDGVAKVELPGENEDPAGKSAVLIGWGAVDKTKTNSDVLQKVTLDVMDAAYCKKKLVIYDTTYDICAGKMNEKGGQCFGDNGGPMLIDGKQHGIMSWTRYPCGQAGYGSVSTKVSKYIAWIRKQMEQE